MVIYGNLHSSLPRALHQRLQAFDLLVLKRLYAEAPCGSLRLRWGRGAHKEPTPRPVSQPSRKWPEGSQCRGGSRSLTTVGRESATRTHATAEA